MLLGIGLVLVATGIVLGFQSGHGPRVETILNWIGYVLLAVGTLVLAVSLARLRRPPS